MDSALNSARSTRCLVTLGIVVGPVCGARGSPCDSRHVTTTRSRPLMRLRRRASSDTEDEAEVEAVASASDTGEALQGRQNSLFIDPGLAPRVQQLISDQHAVLAQMGDALEQLFEVAAGLEEHEEQQVSLNFKLLMQRVLQLDTRVRELIDLRNTVALRIEVLCELKHAVAQGTAGANICEIYEARCSC